MTEYAAVDLRGLRRNAASNSVRGYLGVKSLVCTQF